MIRDEEVDLIQKSAYKCRTHKITTNILPNFYQKIIVETEPDLKLNDSHKIKGGNDNKYT